MTDRLRRAAQWGLTALQIRKRDPETLAPAPIAYQQWMCPGCGTHHMQQPIDLKIYNCPLCNWCGTRHELCRGDLSCLRSMTT